MNHMKINYQKTIKKTIKKVSDRKMNCKKTIEKVSDYQKTIKTLFKNVKTQIFANKQN